ncbi:MAG: hypothetical protein H7101_06105 [Deinococcales bacterium]|nr:hypothetical protein [Chitinophagaceae bacterium]
MKKLLVSLSILSTMMFSSCSKNINESEINKNRLITPKSLNFIGVEHNKGLDFIYNGLKNGRINNGENATFSITTLQDRQEVLDLVEEQTHNYIDNNYPQDPTLSLAHQLISSVCTEDFVSSVNGGLYNNQLVTSITSNEVQFLDQLNVILSDDDNSITSIISRIEQLEMTASTFSDEEKYVVFSASVVAKNSFSYWNEHFDDWQNLFHSNNFNLGTLSTGNLGSSGNYQTLGAVNWKNVGKADVAGAVGGAIRSGVGLFFGPVGWGSFGLSVIGTALGGSGTAAVYQWLQ